ncbi:hypothetical protein Ahia01_000190100 [Argonauta hians]
MAPVTSLKKSHKLGPHLALLPSEQKEFEKYTSTNPNKVTRRGVVYLRHIPYGFFEDQMKAYFSQFGKVTRLRLSRSKRTGKSKGFAFIEFLSEDVARIVADTMNNYILFENLLKCKVIPHNRVRNDLFKGCYRKFTEPKSHLVSRDRHNSFKSDKAITKKAFRSIRKLMKNVKRLKEMGIDFDSSTLENNLKTGLKEQITARKNANSVDQEKKVENKEVKMDESSVSVPESSMLTTGNSTKTASIMLLEDDSSDEEIELKTPPNCIKRSKLETLSKKQLRKQGELNPMMFKKTFQKYSHYYILKNRLRKKETTKRRRKNNNNGQVVKPCNTTMINECRLSGTRLPSNVKSCNLNDSFPVYDNTLTPGCSNVGQLQNTSFNLTKIHKALLHDDDEDDGDDEDDDDVSCKKAVKDITLCRDDDVSCNKAVKDITLCRDDDDKSPLYSNDINSENDSTSTEEENVISHIDSCTDSSSSSCRNDCDVPNNDSNYRQVLNDTSSDSSSSTDSLYLVEDDSDDEVTFGTHTKCIKRSELSRLSKKQLLKVKTIATVNCPSHRVFPDLNI